MTEPPDENDLKAALEKIEAVRKARGISVRTATSRVTNISESYWRQFVAGGVQQNGIWIPRSPNLDQVLKMAGAIGIAAEVAEELNVEVPPEQPAAISRSELEEMQRIVTEMLEKLNKLLEN